LYVLDLFVDQLSPFTMVLLNVTRMSFVYIEIKPWFRVGLDFGVV
jgi:hypothetical protein